MADRRREHLDALERRLTGPKRIGLFGHRNVGKTTLLAMFYRQASTGQVPGLRLAATDPASAEYLAEKIAQIESGEPPAGTLAETELRLRLYHGPARFDLIVKDYQGEHVSLGSDEPIRAFFADCDAVLLCLDPEGPASPAERRRRQQEVEELLERYIERSDDATAGIPLALLLTKFDRVRLPEPIGPGPDGAGAIERLVEQRYGMTRHALAVHAPRSAMFAVSAYGTGSVDGRPPAELHPIGLEGPLAWLADELEAGDLERLEWLWDLAPDDLPRLSRCVAAYEKRYPRSDRVDAFRRRLAALRSRRNRRRLAKAAALAGVAALALAGYDLWGYRAASAFERDHPAAAVRRRWSDLLVWHPTLPAFFPGWARQARDKVAEWTVRAEGDRIAGGELDPAVRARLGELKAEAPALIPEIRKVEDLEAKARHEARWKSTRAEVAAAFDRPETALEAVRAFLRDFPDTEHKDEALGLAEDLRGKVAERLTEAGRRALADLERAETQPGSDLRDLIARAEQYLAENPSTPLREAFSRKIEGYVRTLDDQAIDRARDYSRRYPTNFPTRIERYNEYLKSHQAGGRYISEATEAKDRVLREWDTYAYRQAYDHLAAHPDDVAEVARRLRDYLRDHRDGRFARDAQAFLDWFDRVSAPETYRVTVRRGEFDPGVGKYLSGGGPDLAVVLEVGGVTYGPSPVIPNSHRPIWDYTFNPIRWKLGDPVTIRVVDHDWSDSDVVILRSRKGDPLAMRLLTGEVTPAHGGKTRLVFASDFRMPRLSRPD